MSDRIRVVLVQLNVEMVASLPGDDDLLRGRLRLCLPLSDGRRAGFGLLGHRQLFGAVVHPPKAAGDPNQRRGHDHGEDGGDGLERAHQCRP
ncbi:MAG TPA: hypothetical protein VFB02_14000 [Bradyrhizobium sp.]|nr:hypothetical protein [Bradyrhizobium sp.]